MKKYFVALMAVMTVAFVSYWLFGQRCYGELMIERMSAMPSLDAEVVAYGEAQLPGGTSTEWFCWYNLEYSQLNFFFKHLDAQAFEEFRQKFQLARTLIEPLPLDANPEYEGQLILEKNNASIAYFRPLVDKTTKVALPDGFFQKAIGALESSGTFKKILVKKIM